MDNKANYEVVSLLWSDSLARYIHPGEVVQLDSKTASILLAKNAVKPHKIIRKKVTKELNDGTNNRTDERNSEQD
jgi:hypothetical protein